MAPSEFSGEKADQIEWESDVIALHKTFKVRVKEEVIFFHFLFQQNLDLRVLLTSIEEKKKKYFEYFLSFKVLQRTSKDF